MTRITKKSLHRICLATVLMTLSYCAYAYDLPKWFPFNEENALNEWQEKIFKDKVMYSINTTQEDGYLSAKSDKACSGLLYKIKFDAREKPLISWSWRIKQFPEKNTTQEKKGGWVEKDDYAARVYVIFPRWNFLKTKSIEYIWDEELPEGTIMNSPYSKNIKLIVVQSGRKNMGNWVLEKRNILKDYKQAFGKLDFLKVGAIALMTDADNTASTAEAQYKNIKVGYTDEYIH